MKKRPLYPFIRPLIGFFIIAALVVLPACKKGENDPGFTLRTRKGRLAGTWTLQTATTLHGDTTTAYAQDSLATTLDSITTSLKVTNTMQFDKNGTYGEITVTDYPTNWQNNGQPAFTGTETLTGIWNFTGNGGDVKSKSQLLLQITERTITASNSGSNVFTTVYTGPTLGFIYDIDRLASKELTLKYEHTTTGTQGTLVKTGEYNFTK